MARLFGCVLLLINQTDTSVGVYLEPYETPPRGPTTNEQVFFDELTDAKGSYHLGVEAYDLVSGALVDD